MSLPSLRGSSGVLRGIARPSAIAATKVSLSCAAKRASSSMTLDGQQQVSRPSQPMT